MRATRFRFARNLRLVALGLAAAAAVVAGALSVTGSNTITTVAGTARLASPATVVRATSARIWRPSGLAFDAQGNMYIADPGDPNPNDRIRKVTPDGTITTFAGGVTVPGPGNGDGGPATLAELDVPEGVAVARSRQRLHRRPQPAAGSARSTRTGSSRPSPAQVQYAPYRPADCGDGGPATLGPSCALPNGVAVDALGNVYISDRDNMRVRKVDTSGIITTIAGDRYAGLGRRRRPGHLGAAALRAGAGRRRGGQRLHRRSRQPPRAQG